MWHRLELGFSKAFCFRKATAGLMLKSQPPSCWGGEPGEEGCCHALALPQDLAWQWQACSRVRQQASISLEIAGLV